MESMKQYKNYKLVRQIPIGKGQNSLVRLVVDINTNIQYAMKGSDNQDQSAREQLQKEADILQTIQNNYVIRFVECFEQDGDVFIITEYYKGMTLKSFRMLATQGLQMTTIIKILKPVVLAVFHMHLKNIVHFDITEDNILKVSGQDDSFYIKVCDFGQSFHEKSPLKSDAKIQVNYCDPQLKRTKQMKNIDIYQIGLLIYYLCQGKSCNFQIQTLRPLSSELPQLDEQYRDLQSLFEMCITQNLTKRINTSELLMQLFKLDYKYNQQCAHNAQLQTIQISYDLQFFNVLDLCFQNNQDQYFPQYILKLYRAANEIADPITKNQVYQCIYNEIFNPQLREKLFQLQKTINDVIKCFNATYISNKEIKLYSQIVQFIEVIDVFINVDISKKNKYLQPLLSSAGSKLMQIHPATDCLIVNNVRQNIIQQHKIDEINKIFTINQNASQQYDIIVKYSFTSPLSLRLNVRFLNIINTNDEIIDITLYNPQYLQTLNVERVRITNMSECTNLCNLCSRHNVYEREQIISLTKLIRFQSQRDTYNGTNCLLYDLFKVACPRHIEVMYGDNVVGPLTIQCNYQCLNVFYVVFGSMNASTEAAVEGGYFAYTTDMSPRIAIVLDVAEEIGFPEQLRVWHVEGGAIGVIRCAGYHEEQLRLQLQAATSVFAQKSNNFN